MLLWMASHDMRFCNLEADHLLAFVGEAREHATVVCVFMPVVVMGGDMSLAMPRVMLRRKPEHMLALV